MRFQQHSMKEKEKTKRATLPSAPFVDDEVTSQQVLECWMCSARELCTEHRFRRLRRTYDRSTFAKVVYEGGEQGKGEGEPRTMNKVKIVQ